MARQAAADATGATDIGEPGRIEADPAPGDPLLADTTGAASGWKYYYTFGPPAERQMLTVGVSQEQKPVVSEPFSIWEYPYLDARLPLPEGWIDSEAFLAYAMALDPSNMERWVPATFFEAYEDAAIKTLTLVGHHDFLEDAVWDLRVESASCNVEIRVLFRMSLVSDFHGGSYPGHPIGACFPASTEPVEVERFTPLALGGYWEYTLTERSEGWRDSPAYVTLDVQGDTTVSGRPYTLLLVREYDDGERERSMKVCGIGTDDDGAAYTVDFSDPSGGGCTSVVPIDVRPVYYHHVESGGSVVIGGLTYPVAATALRLFSGAGTGGSGGGFRSRYAADVGLYYYHHWRTDHQVFGGREDHHTYELSYAEAGGKTFGAAVVSVEEASPTAPAASRIAAVFPNPAEGAIRVRLREAAMAPMAYAVYDVAGRRVAEGAIPAGTREVTVELGSGAAGVLLLRISDGRGHSETRRLVRLPGRGY